MNNLDACSNNHGVSPTFRWTYKAAVKDTAPEKKECSLIPSVRLAALPRHIPAFQGWFYKELIMPEAHWVPVGDNM